METKKEEMLSQEEIGDEFDVLCLINGRQKRVPFSHRHLGEPIGIFPFKDEPEYIELDEIENKKHNDGDVKDEHLLNVEFCERVYKIKAQPKMSDLHLHQ